MLECDGGWREHRQGTSGLPSGRLRTIVGLESTLGIIFRLPKPQGLLKVKWVMGVQTKFVNY